MKIDLSDYHLVDLEEKVVWLEGEMEVLQKEKADRLYLDARAAEAKAYGMLSQIMDYAGGAPPINRETIGLDAVLILKHLEGLVRQVREGDTYLDDFFDEVEQYVEQCMQKAKTVHEGDSND